MTSKRLKVSIIYFVVVILTLLMRVASALDIYSALGIEDADAFWTIMIQIVIFGLVPGVLYLVLIAGKDDKLLPYFPHKARKKKKDDEPEKEQFSFVSTEYLREEVPAVSILEEPDLESAENDDANISNVIEDKVPNQTSETQETPKEKKGAKAKRAFAGLFHDFGFKKVSGRDALRTLVLAICMIVIGTGVSMLWQMVLSLTGFTRSSSHTHYTDVGFLIEELVLVAILPGFFEEFSHRGLLYAGFKETGWKFVLLSGLFFSLMHQNIVQTGYTFTDGIMMALVMYYTGSIWPSMFMHFANNAWSVIIGFAADQGGAFEFISVVDNWLYSTVGGLAVCIVAVLVCAGLTVLMFWRMRKEAVIKARIDDRPFKNTRTYPLVKDLLFWLTIAVGVAATTFSFVWGVIR